MVTVFVYAALGALLLWAWLRSRDRVVATLACAFVVSLFLGRMPPSLERQVCMIMAELAVVYGMRFWCYGRRAYFVGLIGFFVIGARLCYMSGWHINHSTYAAALNAAFAVQLVTSGGGADDIGRWFDNWLCRFWPRGSSLLRNVAG
jgi:hypothetical protein